MLRYPYLIAIVAAVLPAALPMQPAYGQQRIPRIINGVPTTNYESVGLVGTVRYGNFCSGTLIGPRHVLTAAHCAEVIEGDRRGTFTVGGTVYLSAAIFIHPDYNSNTLDNDIAIIVLRRPVEGIDPSPIFRDTPQVDDTLTIVGFGSGGDGTTGGDGTFGVKRVGMTTIDDITDTLIVWYFDDPAEGNTASGDSGGPGFIKVAGTFYVASVTSAGTDPDSKLGDIAFNTRVDAYADWIDIVLEATTEIPGNGQNKCPSRPSRRPGPFKAGNRPFGPQAGRHPGHHHSHGHRANSHRHATAPPLTATTHRTIGRGPSSPSGLKSTGRPFVRATKTHVRSLLPYEKKKQK